MAALSRNILLHPCRMEGDRQNLWRGREGERERVGEDKRKKRIKGGME